MSEEEKTIPDSVEILSETASSTALDEQEAKRCARSGIGGQAVIEGVMMRGVTATALAVRSEEGELLLETTRNRKPRTKINKVPFFRGIVNFVAMLVVGMKALMKSANVFGTDDEEMPKGFIGFSVFFGIVLAVALFIFLPSLIMDGLIKLGCPDTPVVSALIEGLFRLVLFVIYILLTTLLKDIRRTYMYHGAEHKTINCYENGLPLTVENVKNSSKVHKRCGTTFLFIVLIVTILVFALANWITVDLFGWSSAWWIKLLVRLVLLPLVAGISYEVLKFLAWLPDNRFSKVLRAPGLSLQALTTREPDEGMIECAIAAFRAVLEMDADPDKETVSFENVDVSVCRSRVETVLATIQAEPAETDWILCAVLECGRNELGERKEMKRVLYNRALKFAKERAAGKPLAYVLGNTEFYGEEVIVTPSVLIPRPETELVAEQAILILNDKSGRRAKKSPMSDHTEPNPGDAAERGNGEEMREKSLPVESDAAEQSDTESVTEGKSEEERRYEKDLVSERESEDASDRAKEIGPTEDAKNVAKKTEAGAKTGRESHPKRRILRALDLCTGSGCIALALAKHTDAEITATDVSPEALNVARRNLSATGVTVVQSDLFENVSGKFDVIVSNPPYVATGDLADLQAEVKKEPMLALNGGSDGLDAYRAICARAGEYLKRDGVLILELGIGQADAVKDVLEGWTCEIKPDYAGIDRILIAKKGNANVGKTGTN